MRKLVTSTLGLLLLAAAIDTARGLDSPVGETKTVTVYVTKTGEKYHTGSCRHLSKSKIAISLEKAKGRYTPCSICRPPQ